MMKDNLTVGLCYPVVTNITKFNDEYNMVMDLFAPRQPDKELNYCYSWYQFSMSLCQYENWILLTGLVLFFCPFLMYESSVSFVKWWDPLLSVELRNSSESCLFEFILVLIIWLIHVGYSNSSIGRREMGRSFDRVVFCPAVQRFRLFSVISNDFELNSNWIYVCVTNSFRWLILSLPGWLLMLTAIKVDAIGSTFNGIKRCLTFQTDFIDLLLFRSMISDDIAHPLAAIDWLFKPPTQNVTTQQLKCYSSYFIWMYVNYVKCYVNYVLCYLGYVLIMFYVSC